ncbi:MAG TPA: mechanosensitive ion channel domain-containing protein [Bacteroidia bacterium]|nr:mechanosensitive ion channel domain-containing protein [Bacteroidia bacterium]
MNKFFSNFHLSFTTFLDYLPALLGGIFCFIITFFLANFFSNIVSKYAIRRSKDTLIANFIGKITWSIIFVLGTVLALGILGLGTISNKILAGAGLTTFIVGFALKDIGENFLSGILLAFSRPFHVGNFIECTGVQGVVKDMTMRQTTIEADNGKIIFIPNSLILNNPLIKHLNNDNNLRQEFSINIETNHAQKAAKIITDTINSFAFVMHSPTKKAKVVIDSLNGDKIKMLIVFWLDKEKLQGSKSDAKSEIIFAVFEKLNQVGYSYS